MVLNIFVLGTLILYFLHRWRNRAMFRLANQLNNRCLGVCLPIIGQSYLFRGNAEDRFKAVQKLGRRSTENGGVTALWHTHRLLIVVSDAEVADFLLKTCLEKDIMMDFFTYLFGNGSIFAPAKEWRPRRKATAPIFNQRNLTGFVNVFARHSGIMADRLRAAAVEGAFALWPYLTAYTLDSVCESTFGVSVDTLNEENHPFSTSFNKIIKMAMDFVFHPYLHNTVMFRLLCHVTGNTKNSDVVCGFVDNIIKETQEKLEQGPPSTQKRLTSFMELYMQSCEDGKKLTALELREEAIVLVVAASESSAVGAGFTLMMLARHPEVQEKVYEELQEVLGKTYRTPTYTDLPRLKYLEAVIKESMRLYPPVPAVVRKVHQDVTLPTGVTLLKDCGILMSIEGLHRNPKYWGADADCFKPERFLDSGPSHPAAYMPFSYGPRGCVGYKYAMMSMLTALATILQQHKVLPPDHIPDGLQSTYDEAANPLRLNYNVLIKEAHGFTVKLESRQ